MIEFDSPDKFIGTTAALILGGLSAAGAIGGAAVSAHASEGAAKTQSDAAAQAAAYSQGQTSKAMDYINGLRATAAPGTANSGAYATLSRLTGGAPMGAPSGYPAPTSAAYPNLFGAQTGGAPTVTLMDDNGVRRQVPREQAQRYIAQGARMVS
jgi:hypothetical protein